jgi:DNA-binding CsgD family transcriptional regulator
MIVTPRFSGGLIGKADWALALHAAACNGMNHLLLATLYFWDIPPHSYFYMVRTSPGDDQPLRITFAFLATSIMKQIVIGFGLLIASLLILFRLAGYAQYRLHYGMEIWIAAFSILFFIIGIFITRIMLRKEIIKEKQVFVEVPANGEIDSQQVIKLGLSKREHQILQLISEGLSNQQMAAQLYISENTIKKHISNLFLKLDVERRTEAVKKARALRVI